ncbi:hypothetical protein N9M10_02795 [Hellea sp.]|nr:hypothetical protein [Hellea sp.]
MEWIYDNLSFLPEAIQSHIVGMLIIITGYTLSKVLAAIVMAMLPKERSSQETDALGLSWHGRMVRACFWLSWLVFILIALKQIHTDKFNFSYDNFDFYQLSLMSLFAYILIVTEDIFSKFAKTIIGFFQSITLPKSNPFYRFIRRYIWIPIFFIFVLALASPETLGRKLAITIVILFTGWLLSVVVKQAFAATLGVSGKLQKFLPKFLFYFVLVHFLVAAIRLWR